MPLERTDWIRHSPEEQWYRKYTTADGDVYFEVEGEEGVFYNRDEIAIGRDAAIAAGLLPTQPAASNQQPRTLPKRKPSEQHSSTVNTRKSNTAYEHTRGRPPTTPQTAQDNAPTEVEDENEDYELQDKVSPLPPTRPLVLSEESIRRTPVVRDADPDLQSLLTTHSLPEGYVKQPSKFFKLGKVFRVLWVEAKGTTAEDYVNDDDIYKTLRPMVVVKKLEAHCICVPIFSHGGKGVGKFGLTETEVTHHAVVHMQHRPAKLLQAEDHWVKKRKISIQDAFTVAPVSRATLSQSSRIRFDTPYTVHYNLKVLELGSILPHQRERLQQWWRAAN